MNKDKSEQNDGTPKMTAQEAQAVLLEEQQARRRRVAEAMLRERVAPMATVVLDPIRGATWMPALPLFEELPPLLTAQIEQALRQECANPEPAGAGVQTDEEAD